MSTRSKLNPQVREARRRRKQAVRELVSVRLLKAQAIAVPLNRLRRMAHLTGEQKEQTFTKTLRQL